LSKLFQGEEEGSRRRQLKRFAAHQGAKGKRKRLIINSRRGESSRGAQKRKKKKKKKDLKSSFSRSLTRRPGKKRPDPSRQIAEGKKKEEKGEKIMTARR